MRNRSAVILLTVALGLAASACGHSPTPRTALRGSPAPPGVSAGPGQGGSAGGGPGGVPSASSPAPGGTATHGSGSGGSGSGGSGSGGSASGGSASGGSGSGGDGPLTVSVSIVDQPSVSTTQCPYTFTFHAKISVNKGPADVGYAFRTSFGGLDDTGTVHFPGAGPQSATVSSRLTLTLVDRELQESIVLDFPTYDRSHTSTTFDLACGASATTPAADVTHGVCPYGTTFSSTLSIPVGPQYVTYEWVFSDGTTKPGTYTFLGSGAQSTTISQAASVPPMGPTGRLTAVVKITSRGGFTSPAGSVRCDLSGQT